ncbi:murein biosynthesis integral membrane protein MurJ [Sediminicurvatus halobius]|uniref:Probable lipid II flippase MurJ n=1 Tax=Sediminicurvatus halobius TaxID=2182432 RepID=A0A2U2N7I9_9GAMM|nr:murein biosynthesis integral membrane protein MurJ [Spiribacter halobius]PWG65151.1 murein biosynthesis integral membrane protein MurJ [Spiribacter halobius]UEX78899.1 murein biosynthesis integral membrane protein MurJ [Spiribacter halobius]
MRQRLLQSVFTFGGWTLLSRVLGLARDVVLGVVFGPSAATDAFFVAFKIPNFMRRLFAEGAFAQAFVPVLSEVRSREGDAGVRQLAARVSGCLGVVLLGLTVLGVVGAPGVVRVFAPGFTDDAEKLALASELLRLTFPYLMLISLTACAGAVLNTYGSFGPPAFAPVFLNLCLIGGALVLAPRLETGIIALGLAVLAAGVLQLLLQLPFLWRRGLLAWPWPRWRDPWVRRILRLMGPTLFGTSVQQINLLLDTLLASFLITGSISWLYWSDRLMEFPLGVFGIALGTVILPRLSAEHAAAAPAAYSRTLDWALRVTTVIILPAAAGLAVLAVPLLTTMFQYGRFEAHDVLAASFSLMAYGLGLIGFVLVKVLVPGYFARQDTRGPVRCAVIAMLVNMVLSISLILWLHDTGVGHAGLAFATAVAAGVNATLLYRGLRRLGVYRPEPGWPWLRRRVGLATLAMVAVLGWPASQQAFWGGLGIAGRVSALLAAVAGGAAVYFAVLWLAGLRPRHLREPAAEHG